MKIITLPQTDLRTSAVGFGCVGITSVGRRRDAVRLLEHAFDNGVTHFDTARLYGQGQSEGIVGEFLKGKRDRVTVTTKLGLSPSVSAMKLRHAIAFGRQVVRALPFVRSLIPRKIGPLSTDTSGRLDPGAVAASLETSLRELKTDRVDILLLHECTIEEALRPDLIEFLKRQIARGTVRYVGIGSAFAKLRNDAALVPPCYRILQFENSVLEPRILELRNRQDRSIITHSALAPLTAIVEAASARPDLAQRYRAENGIDLTSVPQVTGMLLRYATWANSGGIVLFGTTSRAHLQENLAALDRNVGNAELSAFVAMARELTGAVRSGPSGSAQERR